MGLFAQPALQPGQWVQDQAASGSLHPEWVLNGAAIPGNVASADYAAALSASDDGARGDFYILEDPPTWLSFLPLTQP